MLSGTEGQEPLRVATSSASTLSPAMMNPVSDEISGDPLDAHAEGAARSRG